MRAAKSRMRDSPSQHKDILRANAGLTPLTSLGGERGPRSIPRGDGTHQLPETIRQCRSRLR